MIRKFYVQNFCSIKNKLEISFEATTIDDDTYYNNLFDFKDSKLLKVLAFYGMNASGKSSIIKALAALREIVLSTNLLPYTPFEFDEISKISPIDMGIEFSPNNDEESTVYKYYVSYYKDYLLSERLEKMTSQKPSLLFERKREKKNVDVRFGMVVQNNPLLDAIKNSAIPNKSFLSMFNQFKVPDFYDVYSFFLTKFINISPEVTRLDDILPNKAMMDDGFRLFAKKLLKAADFNITDIYVDKTQMPLINPNLNGPGFMADRDTLFFVHESKKGGGTIEFLKESLGTKKTLVLAQHLYPALSKPSILIIDELESSLHPELTKLILKCFLDETINPHNSQLLFTSHETALLNLNLLRRDEIVFVYKDKNDSASYIKSLKEFHARKGENIEKAYLAGRYSTSPEVKEHLLVEQ